MVRQKQRRSPSGNTGRGPNMIRLNFGTVSAPGQAMLTVPIAPFMHPNENDVIDEALDHITIDMFQLKQTLDLCLEHDRSVYERERRCRHRRAART